MPWALRAARITAEVGLVAVAVISLREPLQGRSASRSPSTPIPPLESGPGTLTRFDHDRSRLLHRVPIRPGENRVSQLLMSAPPISDSPRGRHTDMNGRTMSRQSREHAP
jgi:hypothetical protein